MKFMPDPVSTAAVGGTRAASSSRAYSCHTHPTYTPVDARPLAPPPSPGSASCAQRPRKP